MNHSLRKQIKTIPAIAVIILTVLAAGYNTLRTIGTKTYRLPITSPEGDLTYAFRSDLTSFSVNTDEERFLDINLRPSTVPNTWTGWGVVITRDVPKKAIINIDWEVSGNIPEVIMNIVEKPDNSRSGGQGERWYTQIATRAGRYKKVLLFNRFMLNDYQAEGVQVNGELTTEAPFRIEYSLNPALHKEEVEFRIYDISFSWKEQRLPLLIYSLTLSAAAFLLLLRRRPFLPRDSAAIYLTLAGIAVLAVSFSTVDVINDAWSVIAVPLSVLLFTFLYFKFDISFLLFHFALYPFFFAAVIPYAEPYRFIIISLLLLLPVLHHRWRYSMFSAVLYAVYILFLHISEIELHPVHIISAGSVLILFLAARFIIHDMGSTEQRKMADILYKSILNHTQEAILITDRQNKVIGYNAGFLSWINSEGAIKYKSDLESILPPQISIDWFHWEGLNKDVSIDRGGKIHHYTINSYKVTTGRRIVYQWFIYDTTQTYTLRQDLDKANRELRELSQTDDLTGLANRRKFVAIMEKEWKRCGRNGTTLCIAIGDIDYFKQYNDLYGHLKGDETLRKIAGIWKNAARRPADTPARIGGEEFILIFPETPKEKILPIIHDIQAAVRNAAIPHGSSRTADSVTLSVGIADMIPDPETSWEELYSRADKLLYKAKSAGRNRIEY